MITEIKGPYNSFAKRLVSPKFIVKVKGSPLKGEYFADEVGQGQVGAGWWHGHETPGIEDWRPR
jgi:hypothetical protein